MANITGNRNGKAEYWVNFWGSDPDADNDDCWYGNSYATRSEAQAAYDAPVQNARNGYYRAADVMYVELDGPDINVKRRNPAYRAPKRGQRDDWQAERAMQAGMAFGCDGYNDEMGY